MLGQSESMQSFESHSCCSISLHSLYTLRRPPPPQSVFLLKVSGNRWVRLGIKSINCGSSQCQGSQQDIAVVSRRLANLLSAGRLYPSSTAYDTGGALVGFPVASESVDSSITTAARREVVRPQMRVLGYRSGTLRAHGDSSAGVAISRRRRRSRATSPST